MFLRSLQRPHVIGDLEDISKLDLSENSNIDLFAEKLTCIMIDSAQNARIRYVSSKNNRNKRSKANKKPSMKGKPWFDDRCRLLKKWT